MKTIQERTRDAIAEGKVIGDGHTIFNPDFYEPHFSLAELRKAGLVQTFKSDASSHKSTIYDSATGKPVPALKGVYNLSFLEWLASQLGVTDYRICNGRGFQADVIASAIRLALAEGSGE